MCELFGVNTPRKIQLNHFLDEFFSHGDRHPHGWGMAFFDNGTVQMEKQAVTSTKSARLREYRSRRVMSNRMMAHIRLATKGNMEYENCHPFIRKDETGRTWTLAHNGTIFEGEVMDSYFYVQAGQTDSERILLSGIFVRIRRKLIQGFTRRQRRLCGSCRNIIRAYRRRFPVCLSGNTYGRFLIRLILEMKMTYRLPLLMGLRNLRRFTGIICQTNMVDTG